MKFSELKHIFPDALIQISDDANIRSLEFDTRMIQNTDGSLFFLLPEGKSKAKEIVNKAIGKGIRNYVISSNTISELNPLTGLNYLIVDNTLDALQEISKQHRNNYSYPVLAITGSNGKTIIKEWISEMISEEFNSVKSPKSYNSQIGVPLSVWKMSEFHNFGIFEAGISRKGEMDNLRKVIQPNYGILSNIGSAHDEGFQNRDEKLKEKLKLFKNAEFLILRSNEYDYVKNYQNELGISHLISWGSNESAKYKVEIKKENQTSRLIVNENNFKVRFIDDASLENIIHCIVFCLEIGIKDIQSTLNRIKSVPMRLELKDGLNNCLLIDDTYNHDLAGLDYALGFLRGQYPRMNKSVIISMLEQSGLGIEEQLGQMQQQLEKQNLKNTIIIGLQDSPRHQDLIKAHFYENTNTFLEDIEKFDFSNELILVKGARKHKFESIISALEDKVHGTRLEINLSSITHNLNQFRSYINRDTKLMIMVKAFAYGAGSRDIANILQYYNSDYLGVAYTSEGIELRKLGIDSSIFVMNPSLENLNSCFKFNLEPEIFSFRSLDEFIKVRNSERRDLPVHINVDTGMKRLGFDRSELEQLKEILEKESIAIASIFSHLSSADDLNEKNFTLNQIRDFEEAYETLTKNLRTKPLKHILNSAGILNYPEYQFDMVRLGIGMYGVDTSGEKKIDLKPIARLISEISQIRRVDTEDSIGYSRKGKLEKSGLIGTVPIGYADGFPRLLSNGKGKVFVNGKFAPVVGNVCMDMIMIDLSNHMVNEGDEVEIFGNNLSISDMANLCQTIPYEILTNISQRVKRVYITD